MAPAASEENNSDLDPSRKRQVRSFVLRGGRLTEGQKRALDELWPLWGIEAGEAPIDLASLFGNERPVIMEIGFGNGDATWQMAQAHPEENYIGVEVHKPGVGHLLLRLEEHGLGNVRIACEDVVDFLSRRIRDATLMGVRIYFPDPWPKKRHHKRRMIQAPFIDLLAAKMSPRGILHLATDWEPYARHMLEVMRDSTVFENLAPGGGAAEKPEWRPRTKYEKRGERLGHGVFDLVYRRTA